MPGRILGFDFGGTAAAERKRTSSSSPSSTARRHDSMDHFKRPSIAGLTKHHSSEKKDKHNPERTTSNAPRKHVKFEIVAESPPAMFMDDAARSSGALYSCKVRMQVVDKPVRLSSLHLKLNAVSSTKRPVVERCPDCTTQTVVLKDWNFITEPTTFQLGIHEFPASYLIPGHLPATTHGQVSSVDYALAARAISDKAENFDFSRPLIITRAIRPGNEKNSIRIFPPTNLNLNVTLPPVIHPIGDFPVMCRMSGVTIKKNDTQTRWRLRKLIWRIEEHENCISPACHRHAQKVGGEGRGIAHESVREIGSDELKQGWKTDFDDGQIEGEFTAAINSSLKPNYDVESQNGLKIKHVLVIELVIAEEWAPNKKPNQATPTGAARVLRTQFNMLVTERTGMGIAWDDEMPPMYDDVPASPPSYLQITNYEGDDLNDDIEQLHLGR